MTQQRYLQMRQTHVFRGRDVHSHRIETSYENAFLARSRQQRSLSLPGDDPVDD